MNKEYLNINNIYIKIERANWFWPRFKGLMGKTNINYGMIFPKCNSIHTFFMREPIDIVAINNQNEIIMIARNLDKNKILNVKKISSQKYGDFIISNGFGLNIWQSSN